RRRRHRLLNPHAHWNGEFDAHQDRFSRHEAREKLRGGVIEFGGRLLNSLTITPIRKSVHDLSYRPG
ncbi:hypothetical protein, partial [Microbacterium sp. NPDC089188]|uniref:hypothetical protein n=1 Tax=Microbacterium sp. NPDC089188 TaxID=3154971 RepID=UPI00341E971D